MHAHWFQGIARLLQQHLPSQCAVCRSWPTDAVCEACVTQFAQPRSRCATCALPVVAGMVHCGRCIRTPPPLDGCLAAVPYAYPWSQLVVDFKFQQHTGWATTMTKLMRSAPWVEQALERADHIIPLPLSAARMRERGYNQTLLLAQALAPQKTAPALLHRVRHTPAQSSLTRAERLTQVQHAFAVPPTQQSKVAGQRIVLLDDVMTTGATLHAAAHALRQAGATHITGLVFARAE